VSRADRLLDALAERELDALLVTEAVNVRWLTGFTGTAGLAVVGPTLRGFVTDFRYVERAAAEVGDSFDHHRAPRELVEALPDVLPADRPLRLGFDDAHVSVRAHARLRELLDDRVELVAAGGAVECERAVKEPGEVRRIAAAAQLADEVARAVLGRGLVGRTEHDVARSLDAEMRARGAEPSFTPIVAAGAHGAQPHAEPRMATIPRGTLVVLDWGAELEGYCSDCTRTLATGELDEEATATYELVRRAQLAGLEAVRPGPTGREVDAAAREVIDAAGRGEHFGHGLGHGVGLEVHEEPRLSKRGDDALRDGHVVTVEPGVYLPGRLGVRIEDLVVVREAGPRVLSSLPKDLTRVD